MDATGRRRIGAYVLAADPTWLRSSLARYYDRLDVLVVSAASDGRGWTGRPVRSAECAEVITSIDTRSIVEIHGGEWVDRRSPLTAETAQRAAAIAALAGRVDWVLQLDGDEVLPSFAALERALEQAERQGLAAVEWPMRTLFRTLADGRYLEVVGAGGEARFEYPGAVAVRPDAVLAEARRADGPVLRVVVSGDRTSTQLRDPVRPGEVRAELATGQEAILHNSWARDRRAVRAKIGTWGHHQGWRTWRYYYATWLPARWRWRRLRDFHPLFPHLWPALAVHDDVEGRLDPADRAAAAQTKRLA